jgi:hypothetical protein
MKSKKDIQILLKSGLSPSLLSKLNESQLRVLSEKFFKELDKDSKGKKEETKEAWTEVTTSQKKLTAPVDSKDLTVPTPPPGKTQKVTVSGNTIQLTQNEGEMTEDATVDDLLNNNEFGGNLPVNYDNPQDEGTPDPDGKNDGMEESEIKEKFQSKSQQGLFWARCNKCSDKKCKWCKMAKEFSDSTSKKDYKKMPEKKRPEKTNESSQKYWENKILEMLEEEKKRRKKTPKKESETMILRKPKKMTMFSDEAPMELPIAKMFSIGKK